MTDWQPIITAPKDCKFLGFLQDQLASQIEICIWNKAERAFMPVRFLYDASLWYYDVELRRVKITHWMHLPGYLGNP